LLAEFHLEKAKFSMSLRTNLGVNLDPRGLNITQGSAGVSAPETNMLQGIFFI
jgi:hypothetical protein